MNVPKLRFKEFQEDWKKKTVESISSTVTSGSRDWAQYYSETGDKFIRMTNLVREGINLDLSDLRFVSLPVDSSSEGKRTSLIFGDILVSITAELGKLGWVPNNFGTAYINQHTALIRPSSKVHSKFIAYTLSTKKYNNDLNSLNDSGAKAGLNLSTLKSFSISLPENLTEQTKIATFLSAVDEKIAQLNRKHELLQQYKQGMMQQLFSQKLRFKDDKGEDFPEWVLSKLGTIGKSYNGLVGKTAENFGSGAKYITYKQVFDSRKIDAKKFELVTVSEHEKQNMVKQGDVIFTVSSETAKEVAFSSVLLTPIIEPVYLNSFCFGYRPFKQSILNSAYASFYFRSKVFRNQVYPLAQGSTRFNISKNALMELEIRLPSEQEQIKIANFLSALDTKIDALGQQIKQAREWKQGLLQQMFV